MCLRRIRKILIDPQSKKKQGLKIGDIVRRQYVDDSRSVFTLIIVLNTGIENTSPFFTGALIEGDKPQNGEILDFVRVTNLFDTERSGALYFTSSDSGAPFMDAIDGMPFEKSLCLPYQNGGNANIPSQDKYACIGVSYLSEDYKKSIGEVNRVYRLTKNNTSIPSGQIIGFKQTLERLVKNSERIIISFKIRASKNFTANLSFGYTTLEEIDGRDSVQVTTSWSYQVSIITVEYPEQYQRSLLINVTEGLSNNNDWCEIAELNIVKQSNISTLDGTKVRVGKLTGITDSTFGNLDGYGAYLQNIYANKNINISGTLTAGDESGSASTFYVGKIHKNCIINSISGNFITPVEINQTTSPTGIGQVFSLENSVQINCQTGNWTRLHDKKRYCFSVYIKSPLPGSILISQNGKRLDEIEIITDTWTRIHVSFVISHVENNSLIIELSSTLQGALFSSSQLEEGKRPTLYQPTDAILNEVEGFGAWFNRGGIGGTIQNPLLNLNEDGSISSNNGSFLIRHDGSGELASGALSWNKEKVTFGENVILKWENLDTDAQNNLKGVPGKDAYTIVSSVQNYTFQADSTGKVITEQAISTIISAKKGIQNVIVSIGKLPAVTGIVLTKNDNTKTVFFNVVSNTINLADNGNIEIPVEVDGISFKVPFSWSKAKSGRTGSAGTDAYTINTSRQGCIVNSDKNGNIKTAFTTSITVNALKGSSTIIPSIGALPGIVGCTLSKINNVVTIVFNTGTSLAENGIIDIPVVVDGKNFNVSFSYAKARTGADGIQGKPGNNGIDANLLDWINEWDNAKTQIGATSVVTPKIFTGTKNNNGTITGVAIGNFSLNTVDSSGRVISEIINGVYGFKDGYKTFALDNTGSVLFGKGTQIIKYNAINGRVEFGTDVSLNWINAIGIAKNEAINSAASTAQAKANTAKEAAINAAKSDATTKAETAKNEAIISAAADATAKSNKAKNEAINSATVAAQEKVDAVKKDILDAKNTGIKAQEVANAISKQATDGNWATKLTFIGSTGIYTGSLSANIITSLHLNASQITAGTIDVNRINVNALKTTLITTGNIEALTLNVVRGKIGGWIIDTDALHLGAKNNTGGYTGASGRITLGSAGIRGFKWKLDANGSGALAGGNIVWDANGNITFGSSVILNWTNAANTAAADALGSAKTYADSKKTEAINAAASDATTKSTSALNTAKSYADTKKSEAINAANVTSTEKVEIAQEIAQALALGKMIYRDPTFLSGNNRISVYNNSSNGNVVITRIEDSKAPNDSKFVLSIKNKGTSSPGCGGFHFATTCAYRKIYITKIVAKIPIGRNITFATNSIGTSGTNKWLTSTAGTGEWKEYFHEVTCGTDNFSTTHFFYLNGDVGTTATPVEWFVAYATVFDLTSRERYTTTITETGIYTGTLSAEQVNAVRINAASITAGILAVERLDAAKIKTNIINTAYINGLSCSFTRGTIGGWAINNYNIHSNNGLAYNTGRVNLSLANTTVNGDSALASNNGYIQGLNITGYKAPYGFRLGVGQICDSSWFQTTAKTNCYGLEFLTGDNSSGSWVTRRIVRLSANSVTGELDCSIAGWGITHERIAQRATGLFYSGRWGYMGMSTTNHGSGNIYTGAQTLKGFSISSDTPGTAYHLVLGQMAASGSAIRANYFGLQMMSHTGIEYFALGFNSSSGAVYNKIAGWNFDNNKLYSGNLQLIANGSISNTSNKWSLNNDGSGRLANGNITWDTNGNVTFGSSVSLQWKNDIQQLKSDNYGYRYSHVITINGEHDKYYPIVIKSGDQTVKRRIVIKRSYSEQHPPEWNSATHGGDLSLVIKTNFGGWGGANYSWSIQDLEEQYNNTFAGAVHCLSYMGFAIFLRGGGAIYHIYSDQPITTALYGQTGCQICYNSDSLGQTGSYSWTAPAPRTRSATDIEEIQQRLVTINSKNSYVTLRDHPLTRIDANGIYTGTLTASQVNAVAINATSITSGTLSADRIGTASIVATKLASNSVTSEKIASNSVTAAKIATNAITAEKITAGSVTTVKLATSAITAEKIASNAITAEKISAGSITSTKLATNSVTADKIATNAVTATKINVTDLSAIGAKIGGFVIETNVLYTGDKFGTGNYTGMCIQNLITDRKFSVYKGNGNEVKMFQDSSGYGITGIMGGNAVFQLGSTNKIGPFVFNATDLTANADSKSLILRNSGIVFTGPTTQVIMGSNAGFTGSVLFINGGDFWHQAGTFNASTIKLRGHMDVISSSYITMLNGSSLTCDQGSKIMINGFMGFTPYRSSSSYTITTSSYNKFFHVLTGKSQTVTITSGLSIGTSFLITGQADSQFYIQLSGSEKFKRNGKSYSKIRSNYQDWVWVIKSGTYEWQVTQLPVNWLTWYT